MIDVRWNTEDKLWRMGYGKRIGYGHWKIEDGLCTTKHVLWQIKHGRWNITNVNWQIAQK